MVEVVYGETLALHNHTDHVLINSYIIILLTTQKTTKWMCNDDKEVDEWYIMKMNPVDSFVRLCVSLDVSGCLKQLRKGAEGIRLDLPGIRREISNQVYETSLKVARPSHFKHLHWLFENSIYTSSHLLTISNCTRKHQYLQATLKKK